MTTQDILELAARCEAATGPDRELDASIADALGFLIRNAIGHPIFVHKGRPGSFSPLRYTGSLDAAMSLVPEGWFWRAGHGVLWPGWAHLNRKHPDHCDKDDEHSSHGETPALALCAAALKARASQEQPHG